MDKMIETEWVAGSDAIGHYERKVAIVSGYDCRTACEHQQKGDHGWHGDELLLIVRRAAERTVAGDVLQEAACLRLLTYMLKGQPQPTLQDVYRDQIRAADLSLHSTVLGETVGRECTFVEGGRCDNDSDYRTGIGADDLWSRSVSPGEFKPVLLDRARLFEALLGATTLWCRLMEWRDVAAKTRREKSIEHLCLHCGGMPLSRPLPTLFVEGRSEQRIPRERWGKSHERVLIYIETVCVDHDGQPDGRRLTRNPQRTPPRGNPCDWDDKYSTRLKDGTVVTGHDDWACVEDLIAAGLLRWEGTGTHPVFVLTDLGWDVAGYLRRQRAERKKET